MPIPMSTGSSSSKKSCSNVEVVKELRMSFVKNVQLLLLLCLPSLSLFGQSPEDASTWNESYLDSLALYWPDNTIENPIGAPAWNPKKGKRLTIVQLGDSHIQGDFSSCATRNYLTDRFGIELPPRGFAFPYGMARTNEPLDLKSSSANRKGWTPTLSTKNRNPQPLGLSSSAIEAKNVNSTLHLRFLPERGYTSLPKIVSILYAPSENVPLPLLNGESPIDIDTTRGVATFHFDEPPAKLNLTLKKSSPADSPFRLLGFVFDNEASPLIYHAAGLNGADVNAYLRNTALPLELEILKPDIIIISLGTNDAYNRGFDPLLFASNLRMLIRQLQVSCPGVFVILTTPNDHLLRTKEVNPRVEAASEVIRNLAVEQEVGLWDFNRIMGGTGSIHSWFNHGLTAHDCLHLSPQGYRLQGKLLGVALYRLLIQQRGK